MTTARRMIHVALSIMAPVAGWLLIVIVHPLVPAAMGLASVMLDVLALPSVLLGGFVFIRRAWPQRPWALGFVYFPIMAVVVLYLGAIVGFWLGHDAL